MTHERKKEMKRIFEQFCNYWRKPTCPSGELKSLYKKKVIEGKKFNWPEGKELDKYDEICKECNKPLEINKAECPACEATNYKIQLIGDPFSQHRRAGTVKIYRYQCVSCGRELTSKRLF